MAKVVIVNRKKAEEKPTEEVKIAPVNRVTAQGPDFTAVVDRKDAKIEVKNETREPCLPYGMRGFFFGG